MVYICIVKVAAGVFRIRVWIRIIHISAYIQFIKYAYLHTYTDSFNTRICIRCTLKKKRIGGNPMYNIWPDLWLVATLGTSNVVLESGTMCRVGSIAACVWYGPMMEIGSIWKMFWVVF
jgi:hypothetical protein